VNQRIKTGSATLGTVCIPSVLLFELGYLVAPIRGRPQLGVAAPGLPSPTWNASRLDEAISLHEQTLAARERTQCPDHPDTLASRNNLANVYRAAGRAGESGTADPRAPDP
jgi:hypothetical protein